MQNEVERRVIEAPLKLADLTANPAPVGLMGFGMTTVMLNLHNAGFFPLGTMVLGLGIFYGGLAQFIAGILEWKKGNTFGTTAFMSFGAFWLSLVALLVMPEMGLAKAPATSAMVAYLVIWGVFTLVMFIGTLKLNGALQFIFGSLVILFFLLAIGDATSNAIVKQIAGIEGIICGLSAIYTALAQVLNDVYGRTVLSLWPVKKD